MQEEIAPLLKQAKHWHVTADLSKYESQTRVFKDEEMGTLRKIVREGRELHRERARALKRRLREELLEWYRSRDDLHCDDLKVCLFLCGKHADNLFIQELPQLEALVYPSIVTSASTSREDQAQMFDKLLQLSEFLHQHSDIVPLKEHTGV